MTGPFNGSLRDAFLNEEMFDSLEDARRKLALWRYDDNTPLGTLLRNTLSLCPATHATHV